MYTNKTKRPELEFKRINTQTNKGPFISKFKQNILELKIKQTNI